MSPSTKSKSKDKLAARAVKEQAKTSLKPTPASANNGNGIPGSAYNPLSGTFHALDTEPSAASLPAPKTNGRFRTIDEPEDHSGSSSGNTAEYDSLSNNDSCSGESEDLKEKTTISNAPRKEAIPGSDTDKRDKIRQKNEKKHQRQKEKRALEIHERCNGYLMSRKLEGLAQKLEAMGFSSEQATMALILNEGRVEESVAWLFEVGEDNKQQCATNLEGANIKIDITEELAQIETLEIKYKCLKLEVERAVVAFEGNLEKAEDSLKTLKQEPTMVPPKSEKSGNGVVASAGNNKVASSVQNPAGKALLKGSTPISIQQHRREERDFNYTKPVAAVVQIETGNKNLQPFVQVESTNRNLQPSRKILAKQEVTKPQVTPPVDKRWSAPSSSPSFPYSPVPPLQEAVKPEARYPGAVEAKTNMQTPRLKEPIVVMQRPVSNPPKQSIYAGGRYVNVMSDSERELFRMVLEEESLKRRLGDSPSMKSVTQLPYAPSAVKPSVPWSPMGPPSTRSLSSLATPLGLFGGRGFSGSSAADWSTGGSMPQCDYEKVDWSLDTTPVYTDWSLDYGRQMPLTMKSNHLYDSAYLGAKGPMSAVNGGGGLQEGGRGLVTDPPNSVGSLEWTSPFNGMDLLRAPRQFVKSPSQ